MVELGQAETVDEDGLTTNNPDEPFTNTVLVITTLGDGGVVIGGMAINVNMVVADTVAIGLTQVLHDKLAEGCHTRL